MRMQKIFNSYAYKNLRRFQYFLKYKKCPDFRGAFFIFVHSQKTSIFRIENLRFKRALRKSCARAPLYRYYLSGKSR